MTAVHVRTSAEQLLVEQAVIWAARFDTLQAQLARDAGVIHADSPRGHAARVAATSATEGWAVIYLLALVRELDPDVADRAARYLQVHAGRLTPWMCERLAQRWRTAAEQGQPTHVPLD